MSWANYIITAVKYSEERRHIKYVQTYVHNGNQLVNVQIMPREEVVRMLEANISFVTAYRTSAESYQRGADVNIVRINGRKFIRTDSNSTEKDNLGDLPEF